MRASVALVAILLAGGLDAGFGPILAVGSVRGHLLPGLVVFIALSAPRKLVLRWAMAAGLLVDFLAPAIGTSTETVVVPGPHVLGFALGASGALALRGFLSKHSPLSPGAATFVFSILASLGFLAVWQARLLTFGSTPPWSGTATQEVSLRTMMAVGDALVAIPLLWLLGRTRAVWGFASTTRVVPGVGRSDAE